MTDVQILERGATEFVTADFTASVNLDTQPVHFSFDNKQTWLAGAWTGAVATTRTCRLLVVVNTTLPTPGFYPVHVRVTDNPEIPVRQAGAIEVR